MRSYIQEIYLFNSSIKLMTTVSAERQKLVTNFIIVPAPRLFPVTVPVPVSILTPLQPLPEVSQPPNMRPDQQPTTISLLNRKKYPKDDYQKNITINVVKCCIREILGKRYRRLLQRQCRRVEVRLQQLEAMVQPILKQVVISLGDLKKMLTSGEEGQRKLKSVFCWFLEWYLRNRYMYYLLNEGKMNHKERYIEYKNKYMLYLLKIIRDHQDVNSPIRQTGSSSPQEDHSQ